MNTPRNAETFISLRDMVLQRVRSDIVAGHSAPGTMYSVPSLADELGVSTTPVREALLELSQSGFLTAVRNRGFRVEATSLQELENVFAVRGLLERYAMVSIAEKRLADPDELRRLADDVAAAVKRKDSRDYVEADRAFHLKLVSRTDNSVLTKMIMDLRDGMRLYGMESAAGRQRQIASVKEHYRLIDLGVAGDTDAISALITRHIMDWEPVFKAALSERSGRGPLQSRGR